MRRAFIEALTQAAFSDPKILLLTGDLGFMALEPFIQAHPDRFFNMGVAEQNMVGVATGLAEAGWKPYCYSIVTFATLRPYEFIRNGPILHRLPVRIVGVGGGMEYGHNGLSHFGLEDIGVMRIQPEMTVVCPADHQQAKNATFATVDLPGALYLRLGKDDKAVVPSLDGRFRLDGVDVIKPGDDLLILSVGAVSVEAYRAAEALQVKGVSAAVGVVSTVRPSAELKKLIEGYKRILTVESHYISGGLGSMVCEMVAESGLDCKVRRCGVKRSPIGLTGSQQYMEDWAGVSAAKLACEATSFLDATAVG